MVLGSKQAPLLICGTTINKSQYSKKDLHRLLLHVKNDAIVAYKDVHASWWNKSWVEIFCFLDIGKLNIYFKYPCQLKISNLLLRYLDHYKLIALDKNIQNVALGALSFTWTSHTVTSSSRLYFNCHFMIIP